MSTRYYSREHEWIEPQVDSNDALIGITQYAVDQLGDVVFLELPAPGRILAQGAEAAVIESVKAASEIYAPASGEVLACNQDLAANPATLNETPDTWIMKIRVANPDEFKSLMDEETYTNFVTSLDI